MSATDSCRARIYFIRGYARRASRNPCSTVPGLPNMYSIPSASNCSMIANRPVFSVIPLPLMDQRPLRRFPCRFPLPPPASELVLQHFDEQLAAFLGVCRRTARDERVVHNGGEPSADSAVVSAV